MKRDPSQELEGRRLEEFISDGPVFIGSAITLPKISPRTIEPVVWLLTGNEAAWAANKFVFPLFPWSIRVEFALFVVVFN